MAKCVKEIFKDYSEINNLIDCEIENINLYKQTNKLQVNVISSKSINLADIESFEKYAVKRFKVDKVIIDIKSTLNSRYTIQCSTK